MIAVVGNCRCLHIVLIETAAATVCRTVCPCGHAQRIIHLRKNSPYIHIPRHQEQAGIISGKAFACCICPFHKPIARMSGNL
ncbi:hypothetical protein Barb7_03216 [Bacteroidales bacterium Barb7]|nr:hypothetical protein Barb7_03216 [Bacteroidales bacterium Barb7]